MRITRKALGVLNDGRPVNIIYHRNCPICGAPLTKRPISEKREAWIGNYNRPWYCKTCRRHFARGKEAGR